MIDVLRYIEKMKEMYEGERITAQGPRNMADGGRIGFAENAGLVNANVIRQKEAIKNLNDKWTNIKVKETAEILYPDQDINKILTDSVKRRKINKHLTDYGEGLAETKARKKGRIQRDITLNLVNKDKTVNIDAVRENLIKNKKKVTMVNNQFIFADEKLQQQFLDDMLLRYKYPKTSTAGKNAGVKTTEQLFEKYFKGTYAKSGVKNLIFRFKRKLGLDFSKLPPGERNAHQLRRQAKELISQAGKRISGLDDFPAHHLYPVGDEFAHGTQDFTIIDKKTNSQLSGSNKQLIGLSEQRTQLVNDVSSGNISSKNFNIEMGKLDNQAQTIIDGHYKKFPKHDGLLNWRKATSVLDEQGKFKNITSTGTIGGDASKWAITDVNKQIKDLSKTELATFRSDIKNKAIKTMKDMMHELNAGKSTLAYHTLKKGNINVDDVCFTKGKASGGRIGFKAGSVGQVCGIDFAQNKPNEFLRRVSKMKGADTFLRSAAGLKAAKGLLKSGKYFANPLTLGGGEAWYSYLTFLNERSKGKSMGSSINEALWFIPGNMKRDMEMSVGYEDLRQRKLFPSMEEGQTLDDFGFEAMTDDQKKQFMALKLGKNIGEVNSAARSFDSAQRTLRGENPNLPIAQISPHRDLTEQEQLARDRVEYNTRKFYKDLKEKQAGGEELFKDYSDLIKKTEGTTDVSNEQIMKPIQDVKERIQNQVVSEWNKALPTKYMQGDAWSGKKWSDIKSWAGSTGPFGMWKIGKTAKEEEMLKNMDAKERYLYNVNARGLGYLRGPEDLTWKHYEAFGLPEYARELWFNKGGRAGYMGGGIAAIRKPHAIPPKRQGLRSIMINVNDD